MNTALRAALIGCLLPAVLSQPAQAEWSLTTRGTFFYTSDASLFTASQRLSRDADPTQPALDTRLTRQGSDGVFETTAQVTKTLESSLGKTSFDLRGDGFVFFDQTRYSNGNLGIQAKQDFPSNTKVMVRYYYNPDLFLGDNLERRSGNSRIAPERVTSQIGAMHLAQELTDGLELHVFTRYGTRRYNSDFAQRNTDFWTIGPHLDWKVLSNVKLGLAYHYERGLADGHNQPSYGDDVSYTNNFASAEVEIELTECLAISLGFDYEHNQWLSRLEEDERNGSYEEVYLGEFLMMYKVSEMFSFHAGMQYGSRKINLEPEAVTNANIGLGVKAFF